MHRGACYCVSVSKKSGKIAAMIEGCRGGRHDPHYLGYFECFNSGLYYEAHDVLEELWLADRKGRTGNFYKGLIQLAGAFVLMQKHKAAQPRLKPAARLLRLAHANLEPYGEVFLDLSVAEVLELIGKWFGELERRGFETNPLDAASAPRLELLGE
jgi:hypothetical protein